MAQWIDLPLELRIKIAHQVFEGTKIYYEGNDPGYKREPLSRLFEVARQLLPTAQVLSAILYSCIIELKSRNSPSIIASSPQFKGQQRTKIRSMEIKTWDDLSSTWVSSGRKRALFDGRRANSLTQMKEWFPKLQHLLINAEVDTSVALHSELRLQVLVTDHHKSEGCDVTTLEELAATSDLPEDLNIATARASLTTPFGDPSKSQRPPPQTSAHAIMLDWLRPQGSAKRARECSLPLPRRNNLEWQVSLCTEALLQETDVHLQVKLKLNTFCYTLGPPVEHIDTGIYDTTFSSRDQTITLILNGVAMRIPQHLPASLLRL